MVHLLSLHGRQSTSVLLKIYLKTKMYSTCAPARQHLIIKVICRSRLVYIGIQEPIVNICSIQFVLSLTVSKIASDLNALISKLL